MASGKGTVAQYLNAHHGAAIYRFSTVLRDILDRIYVEKKRQHMQDLSLDLRTRFGDDILASVIAHDAQHDDHDIIVIDGIRRLPDIKHLRALPEFRLIVLHAAPRTRWERMTKRRENPDDAEKNFEQFQKDEQAEAEQQIDEVAATADVMIDNNGKHDQLYQAVEDFLKKCHEH